MSEELSENVTCAKCGTESPRGTDNCPNCGGLLIGHSLGFDHHPENIGRGGDLQSVREKAAKKLVEADGLEWEELTGSDKLLAKMAAKPSAKPGDVRAWMQQAQLLKPAPKIAVDTSVVSENVVIEAEQIENAEAALKMLKEITDEKSG